MQERGAPASRSIRPGDILTAVIAGGVICAALVGGILLRGVVLLGGSLRALAVIAGIGGGEGGDRPILNVKTEVSDWDEVSQVTPVE